MWIRKTESRLRSIDLHSGRSALKCSFIFDEQNAIQTVDNSGDTLIN